MPSDPTKPTKPAAQQPSASSKQQTAKQLAAAAREEAAAAERRRDRTIRGVGALVVLLVVAGLIVVGFLASRSSDTATEPPKPDANAALPAGVQKDTFGVPYGTGWTAENAAKLPTLELWEDFQCPACKALEEAAGADIEKVAEDGLVKLLWRTTTFLDRSFPESMNSSARATSAWGCAIDAGKAAQYHTGIFAMQPNVEGTGYTDDQLRSLGSQVGISGDALTTFERCVSDGTYLAWSANSYQAFLDGGLSGTPTALLNGTEIDSADLADPETLRSLLEGATAT